MAHVKLKAQERSIHGNQVRKLRREGILPGVIYSKKTQSSTLQVSFAEFYRVFKEAGKTHVVDLTIGEGKTLPCIIHDMDIDPVSGLPRHVDFLQVNLKEKVVAAVPVEYVGEAPGVKEFGAVLNTAVQELDVEALPDKLPSAITVDVSALATMTDVIRVVDLLTSAADYSIVAEPELVLASLTSGQEDEPEPEVENAVEDEGAQAASEESKDE
jgi:large subunit ribosomal protein L25